MLNRIKSTVKPEVIESLGNGYYYYNYDIQSSLETIYSDQGDPKEVTMYSYVQVRLHGKPTYDRCSEAIIRQYISDSDEFKLINKYNQYQLGVTDEDPSEYTDYLNTLTEIRTKVKKDFQISSQPTVGTTPRQSDIFSLLAMTINTITLTDQQSLSVKSLYPNWSECVGKELAKDTKVQYNGKLFKVVQTHTAQLGWEPRINTASLFTEIVEDHAGTIEDPIPYPEDGNMIIYNGKYYIENQIIYKCIRDSGQPLYASLSSVVGNYVEVAQSA